MENKARCLCMSKDYAVYLHVEYGGEEVRIPLGPHLMSVRKRYGDKDLHRLSASMPKFIQVKTLRDTIDLASEAFAAWYAASREIEKDFAFLGNQLDVYGPGFEKSLWFKCAPLCLPDPCPITDPQAARQYLEEKWGSVEGMGDITYADWRNAALQNLKLGDGYINAYSFSRKLVRDPDIALALAANMLLGHDVETRDLDIRYGIPRF